MEPPAPSIMRGPYPATFFATPYNGTQYDTPLPSQRPVRNHNARPTRPDVGSRKDVRKTYSVSHIRSREPANSARPPVEASRPTLEHYFVRANIDEGDHVLREHQNRSRIALQYGLQPGQLADTGERGEVIEDDETTHAAGATANGLLFLLRMQEGRIFVQWSIPVFWRTALEGAVWWLMMQLWTLAKMVLGGLLLLVYWILCGLVLLARVRFYAYALGSLLIPLLTSMQDITLHFSNLLYRLFGSRRFWIYMFVLLLAAGWAMEEMPTYMFQPKVLHVRITKGITEDRVGMVSMF